MSKVVSSPSPGRHEPPGPPAATRVALRGVTQQFVAEDGANTHALGPIDLGIGTGEFVSIVGPSGCGKSTLLRLVAGFIQPTIGTVEFDGAPVTGPGPERGMVFQQPNLYPWLDVAGNVEFGLRMRRIPKSDRSTTVADALALVGLEDFGRHRPYELSGGMQQRCQLARVLVNEPSTILLDEPFGALDALTRERLQSELLSIWRRRRTTALLVTHSVDEACLLGTRVLVMSPRPGSIVADLPAPFSTSGAESSEIRDDPAFIDLRRQVAAHLSLDV